MPRPMLRPMNQTQTQSTSRLDVRSNQRQNRKQASQMDQMVLDRTLRQKRSKKYMEALRKLDAGGHVMNQAQKDAIIDDLRDEFPELEISGILLGYVAKCYLGNPYEVHTLDISGGIIEHYKMGCPLPSGLEKARGIAIHGGYEFIEVYADCCRAISADGSVSVIR